MKSVVFLFFFQAEDGIRDTSVTGVQTCALPICNRGSYNGNNNVGRANGNLNGNRVNGSDVGNQNGKIGRASCRERV